MKKEHKIQVVSVLIILIFCCINIRQQDYIRILNDEFGYWSHAVSAVGYDWKDLIVETPYYSWGYSLWLIPIVALLPTPELWYKAAIMLNTFFLIASYFLCVKSGKRLFPKANKSLICIVSLLVIIYPGNIAYAQLTWTESLLCLLMWLETYLIISLDEEFKLLNFLSAVIVLIYMYAVHARCIGIVITGVIFLCIVVIKHKKSMGYLLLLIALMVMGYRMVELIKNYQLSTLWNDSQMSKLNNVALDKKTIESYCSKFTKQTFLLLSSIGGKYIYLVIATCLTLPISVGEIIKETIRNIKNNNLLAEGMLGKWWGIGTMLLMWGVCSLQMNDWKARKDFIVYGRYMENAIGPILFMGIMYTILHAKKVKNELVISVLSLAIGLYPVFRCVWQANGGFVTHCSPMIGVFYEMTENKLLSFTMMVITLVALTIGLLWTIYSKNMKARVLIIGMVMGIFFSGVGFGAIKDWPKYRNSIDAVTVPFREKISGDFAQNEIYYIKNSDTVINPKYFQFLIPGRTIHVVELRELDGVMINGNLLMVHPDDKETLDIIEANQRAELIDESYLLCVYKAGQDKN